MPRRPRVHVSHGVYHAILRGNHRQPIFLENADYYCFERILAEALARYRCRLHAYCWMTNHIHMAIQVGDRPLGALMQLVASRFARITQRAVPTTGHFFEKRYHAILVDRDAYLLELTRYIHLNPVRAGIARTASEYRWSSHSAYLGVTRPAWLTTELLDGLLGDQSGNTRENYKRFMEVEPSDEEIDRVRQGWPDEVGPVADVPPNGRESLVARLQNRCNLDEVIESELARRAISLADLTGPGKQRALSAARAEIAHQALTTGVATLSEVASKLNRSAAALSALVRRSRGVSRGD